MKCLLISNMQGTTLKNFKNVGSLEGKSPQGFPNAKNSRLI